MKKVIFVIVSCLVTYFQAHGEPVAPKASFLRNLICDSGAVIQKFTQTPRMSDSGYAVSKLSLFLPPINPESYSILLPKGEDGDWDIYYCSAADIRISKDFSLASVTYSNGNKDTCHPEKINGVN